MMRVWMTLLAAGLLLLLASFLPTYSPAIEPASSEAAVDRSTIEQGRALFMAKGCATCHRHDGTPGLTGIVSIGPDLSHYQPAPEFVRLWLSDPAAIRPNTNMPNLNLNEAEIEALITFLADGENLGSAGVGLSKEKSPNEGDAETNKPKNLTASGAAPPKSCPITTKTAEPFVPPKSYPETSPYENQFWFGSASLWTLLPNQGTWNELPRGEAGYVQKVFWGREGYNWREEPMPALTVTGRRLDGSRQSFKESDATNGYQPDLGSFMLTGIEIPDYGCWEITGEYGGHSLSFVIWVGP